MTEALQVAIVGGGIGGLTAAAALRARGGKVTVFEQAEELREIGAGISLNPNAALLLRRLELDKRLADIGTPMSGLNVRTSNGELVAAAPPIVTPVLADPNIGHGYNVHRADFLKLLVEMQPEGEFHLGFRCNRVQESGSGVKLEFANGAAAQADCVIGADGIHSVIRRELGIETRALSEGIHGVSRTGFSETAFCRNGAQRTSGMDRLRPQLSVLPGRARPTDQHGRVCAHGSRCGGIVVCSRGPGRACFGICRLGFAGSAGDRRARRDVPMGHLRPRAVAILVK